MVLTEKEILITMMNNQRERKNKSNQNNRLFRCNNCGYEFRGMVNYCPNCGIKLKYSL